MKIEQPFYPFSLMTGAMAIRSVVFGAVLVLCSCAGVHAHELALRGTDGDASNSRENPRYMLNENAEITHDSTQAIAYMELSQANVQRRDTVRAYYFSGELFCVGTIRSYKTKMWEGPLVTYYKNGNVQIRSHYKRGKLSGMFLRYWEGGQLLLRCSFSAGRMNGASYSYDRDGTPNGMREYRNDKLHGRVERYAKNGNIVGVSQYRNGYKHGVELLFHPNGRLSTVREWDMDQTVGLLYHWTEEGVVYSQSYRVRE